MPLAELNANTVRRHRPSSRNDGHDHHQPKTNDGIEVFRDAELESIASCSIDETPMLFELTMDHWCGSVLLTTLNKWRIAVVEVQVAVDHWSISILSRALCLWQVPALAAGACHLYFCDRDPPLIQTVLPGGARHLRLHVTCAWWCTSSRA